jgi:transposase
MASVARDLGIGVNLLGRWKRQHDEMTGEATGNTAMVTPAEHQRVQRELAKVKMQRDILKKTLGFFAADPK